MDTSWISLSWIKAACLTCLLPIQWCTGNVTGYYIFSNFTKTSMAYLLKHLMNIHLASHRQEQPIVFTMAAAIWPRWIQLSMWDRCFCKTLIQVLKNLNDWARQAVQPWVRMTWPFLNCSCVWKIIVVVSAVTVTALALPSIFS